eukprot:Gb_21266 [translate_table: standard]
MKRTSCYLRATACLARREFRILIADAGADAYAGANTDTSKDVDTIMGVDAKVQVQKQNRCMLILLMWMQSHKHRSGIKTDAGSVLLVQNQQWVRLQRLSSAMQISYLIQLHLLCDSAPNLESVEQLSKFPLRRKLVLGMNGHRKEGVQQMRFRCDISLDDLSAKERKDFLHIVASGKISRMLRPWEPWWLKPAANTISLSNQGSQLVRALDMPDDQMAADFRPGNAYSNETDLSDIPAGPEKPLSSVKQLTSTEPSPLLPIHIIDVLYSYCFTLRFFNGDWQSDSVDAATVCLSLSAVLGQVASPETVSEALAKCLETACSPSFKHAGGLNFGIGLFDDVVALLRLGREALVCALMDLYRLLEAAAKEVKAEKSRKKTQVGEHMQLNQEAKRKEIRKDDGWKKLQFALRKVYFLMCWTNEQPINVWLSLAALVETEKNALPARNSGNPAENAVKVNGHETQKPKLLIEEVGSNACLCGQHYADAGTLQLAQCSIDGTLTQLYDATCCIVLAA